MGRLSFLFKLFFTSSGMFFIFLYISFWQRYQASWLELLYQGLQRFVGRFFQLLFSIIDNFIY